MKIINPHNKISRPVVAYDLIMSECMELVSLVDEMYSKNNQVVALHHAQVSDDPLNFFVLSAPASELFENQRIIINPTIVSKSGSSVDREGCLSFPFRPARYVKRASEVLVTYEVPFVSGIVQKTLNGLAAIIFQHETDHGKGINIYQKNKV